MTPSSAARAAALQIVVDLGRRRGLRQEWDQIDPEIQEEIVDEWARIIEAIFPEIRNEQ